MRGRHEVRSARGVTRLAAGAGAVVLALGVTASVGAATTAVSRSDAQSAVDTLDAYLTQPEPTTTVTATATLSIPVPGPTVTVTATPSATVSAPATLPFRPPQLTNPVTIQIAAAGGTYSAPSTTDCIFIAPQVITGPVTLNGCDDRVWRGGVIGGRTTVPSGSYDSPNRGVRIYDTSSSATGTDYIEGLWFKPGTYLSDAIQGAYRVTSNRTLIVQNVRVDSVTYGSKAGVHADTVQMWGGPQNLHVHNFTATASSYQGIFMANDVNNARGSYTFSRINLIGKASPSYCFTDLSVTRHDITASDVWCSGFTHVGTNDSYSNAPGGVKAGLVADFVPASLWSGATYLG